MTPYSRVGTADVEDEENTLELQLLRDDAGEAMEQPPSPITVIEVLHKLRRAFTESLSRHPVLTNMALSGLIGFAGNAMSQKLEGNKNMDVRRFMVYGLISVFYVAPFAYYWVLLLEKMFNAEREPEIDSIDSKVVVQSWASKFFKASKMIVFDQLLGAPICKFEC